MHGEDHAVVAARLDGHWLTLDNRRMAMIEDSNMRSYRPLFVIDQTGVMRYTDTPPKTQMTQIMAAIPNRDLPNRDLGPSSTPNFAAQPGLIPPAD